MTNHKTWHPAHPSMTDLRDRDRVFLSEVGIEVGCFGHFEVDEIGEALNMGVVLGYVDDVEIVCTPWGVVALDDAESESFGRFAGRAEESGYDPDLWDEWGVGRPVSSSAELFQAALWRFAQLYAEVAASAGEARQRAVDAAASELRAMDPAAWGSDDFVWPRALDGLLREQVAEHS